GGAMPEARLPDGYVDLLTWQSRRILLVPTVMPDGGTRVSGAVLMKGYQFAESFEQWGAETMVAYRKNTTVKNGPPWFAIKLDPERIVWRDSQALIQSVADERQRPKVMGWLDTLVNRRAMADRPFVPLEIYGLIPDQANILDWRREALPLPLNLLEQQKEATQHLLQRLQEAITLAESIARLFDATLIDVGRGSRHQSPMWVLCEGLLAGLSEREPKREDCATLARSFGAGPCYWSRLDAPFRAFIVGLADTSDVVEEGGATRYGMRALRGWAAEVRRIARDVFHDVIDDLDTSARMLYASATAEQRFDYLLGALMAPYRRASDTAEKEPEGVTL
ncbi:MAG: type I-E CRISPR-associated protein Cse1/CasA, partial [Ktedonobacterales bacterium]